jgi:Ca2+/Na+ antiporter
MHHRAANAIDSLARAGVAGWWRVTASLRGVPAIAFGDVIGANIAICLVALGVGAALTPLPFGASVALGGLAAVVAWDGQVGRAECDYDAASE